MKELIEVFRMDEVSKETRCRLLIKLGEAINAQYAMNLTEPLVAELVEILIPGHPELERLKNPFGLSKPSLPDDLRGEFIAELEHAVRYFRDSLLPETIAEGAEPEVQMMLSFEKLLRKAKGGKA